MARFALHRLMQAALLLLLVSMIGFAILHLAPGGPLSQFALSSQMSQEDLDRIARQLGLDRPLPEQFARYVADLARGDLGRSLTTGQPVTADLGARLRSFSLIHPDADAVAELYRTLDIDRPPTIAHGGELRYRAQIETPAGVRDLF